MLKKLLKLLDRVTPGATRSLGWEVLLTALSFPASILLNRTLGAEDRGLFSLSMLIPSTVITLGTCQWERLVKGLITSKEISSKEAWRRTIYYTFWLSIIFIPLGILASLAYTRVPFYSRIWGALYSLSFPVVMLSLSLSSILIATGYIDAQYSIRVGYQGSYIFLVFILIFFGWLSVPTLILTYFAIWLISLLVGLLKQTTLFKGTTLTEKPNFSLLRRSFLPYAFESFSYNADTWAFSIFGSLLSLGYYVAITGLMQPVGVIFNALNNGSTARLDWTEPLIVIRYLFKTVVTMSLLLVGLVIGGMLIGTQLLEGILGRSFQGGEWMIPWIAGIVVSQAVATQFHFAVQLSGFKNAYLVVQTLESVTRVGFALLLGWQFSELGIFVGCISSSIVKCLACSYVLSGSKMKAI